jgi:hypothetical protein
MINFELISTSTALLGLLLQLRISVRNIFWLEIKRRFSQLEIRQDYVHVIVIAVLHNAQRYYSAFVTLNPQLYCIVLPTIVGRSRLKLLWCAAK